MRRQISFAKSLEAPEESIKEPVQEQEPIQKPHQTPSEMLKKEAEAEEAGRSCLLSTNGDINEWKISDGVSAIYRGELRFVGIENLMLICLLKSLASYIHLF